MTDDRTERLARQIRAACGRYNDDDEAVVVCIDRMKKRIEKLEKENAAFKKEISENSWVGDIDRMSGAFTAEEINSWR